MSNAWFRLYSEFSHDPKVQMMSEAMQRRYIMLLCLRCSNTLVTLHVTEIAFQLRISDDELAETKSLFIAKGLIDSDWNLLNWEKRQFSSDSSKERVAKHRALQKQKQDETCNDDVTLQKRRSNGLDTDTDTDTYLSSTSLPACPYAELLKLYARRLPELPQPRKSLWIAGADGKAMKSRWRWVLTACYESGERAGQRMATTEAEALDWFDRFFDYVSKSNWLMGRDPTRTWHCNLAWLMKLENFTKVLSGNYDNKAQA